MSQSTSSETEQSKQSTISSNLSDFASQAFKGLEAHEKLFFAVAVIFAFLTLSVTFKLQSNQLYIITLILIAALVISLFFVLAKAVKVNQQTLDKRVIQRSLTEAEVSLGDTLEVIRNKRKLLQDTLSTLKTIGEEFEEVKPVSENSLDAADSVRSNITSLIHQISEELRKIDGFLSQYQDWQKIQEIPKELDEIIWKRATMR